MKFYLISLFTICAFYINGQSVSVDFNDCSTDNMGNLPITNFIQGSPNCECGVVDNCFNFASANDGVILDDTIINVLNNDFTLSFYFWPENFSSLNTMFAIKDSCTRDSSFVIAYNPLADNIIIEITENAALGLFFQIPFERNMCWNQIVVTKTGPVYAIYLNNEFIESDRITTTEFVFGENHTVWLGNSPCVGMFGETDFIGKIDEFSIFEQPLGTKELQEEWLFPDQIITTDTTIFKGNSVQIATGNSCADSFDWTPSVGLNNNNIPNPIATPDETTSYEVIFNHAGCSTSDLINIFVIDETELECENILLANTFTPNGDGINDIFGVSNLFLLDDILSFEIYNRWGIKVFDGTGKSSTWNGTFNGEKVSPAMYSYKIEYTCQGNQYQKLGSVGVLR